LPWTLNRASKSRSIPIKPPHSNGYWRTKAISSIHLIAYVGADARGIVAPESPSRLLIVRGSKQDERTHVRYRKRGDPIMPAGRSMPMLNDGSFRNPAFSKSFPPHSAALGDGLGGRGGLATESWGLHQNRMHVIAICL